MPDLSTRVRQLFMKHLLIDMPDMAEANLLPHFQQAVSFISSAIGSSGKVLVHCQAGVSRSACVSLDGLQRHVMP
jgi:protein-tyrosine phosphatase